MNRFYLLGASFVLIGAMASACGDDDETNGTTSATTTSTTTTGTGGSSTTTTGTGGSSTTTTGTGGAGGSVTVDCATYCSTVDTACTAGNDQYGVNGTNEDLCLDVCATWTAGTLGDSGNTIGCRLQQALNVSDAAADCVKAGPMAVMAGGAGGAGGSGGGAPAASSVCGATACDNFCELADAVCTGGNQQWATVAACKADCQQFMGDATMYSANDTSGDSFECRMYHLTAAADDPNVHCTHIVLSTAGNVPCK
jgi:hypothetical protein